MKKSRFAMVACLLATLTMAWPCASEEKKPVPLYTNEDLERVAPFRGETGVTSVPAFPTTGSGSDSGGRATGGRRGRPTKEPGGSARGEEHWRAAAERLREKLRPLRERADELRLQIEERRRQPGVRYADPKVVAFQRKLEILERRIRETESSFEDRARRLGVLPGWLR